MSLTYSQTEKKKTFENSEAVSIYCQIAIGFLELNIPPWVLSPSPFSLSPDP